METNIAVCGSSTCEEMSLSHTLITLPAELLVYIMQTSQLSRFGRETHNFLTDLTTACQSHDFSRFSRNIIIVCLIRYKCHMIHILPGPGSRP